MRNWPELWSQCLSCALSQPLPLPTKARLCPRKEGSPARWHLTHRAASASCSGARVSGGADRGSPEPSLPAAKCPRVAQESGANASLGGGLLRAPHRLVLMVLTSCVSVQEKTPRSCLPAPPLSCSLPPFANIGFKPAQNSVQRKAAAAAAAAGPAAGTPQPQDAPARLLDRLLRDDRPAVHPRYPTGAPAPRGGSEEEPEGKGQGCLGRGRPGSVSCVCGSRWASA